MAKQKCFVIMVALITIVFLSQSLVAQNVRHKKAKKDVVVKHSPSHKYKKLPRIGDVVKTTPKGAGVVNPGNVKLYYYGGLFYKPYAGGFIITRPPKGHRVKMLPNNHIKIEQEGQSYFYYYGVFYANDRLNDDYVIIDARKGVIVDALPEGYEIKLIDDREYYVVDDTWYKEIELENGDIVYKVVNEN